MRAKLFNRLFDYKIFYEIFFLQFLRTLKSHLRLDIKIFCRTYDFCLLCSCQSSEKKIEKKNPRSLRIVGGTIWRGKRKRINALYIHAEVRRRARRKRRYNHSGDYGRKVPPVPIPNTEVKLSYAESTLRDTAWEDRSSPLLNFYSIVVIAKRRSIYCSLAQSVEHRTVNPSVVSSSLTGAAKCTICSENVQIVHFYACWKENYLQ